MAIVITTSGEVCEADVLALDDWDFITKYLDCYSWDADVALSNDLAVVLEVIEAGYTPSEYMSIPEDDREYSNTPFENVKYHVKNLDDVEEVRELQHIVDADLLERAIADFKKKHNYR